MAFDFHAIHVNLRMLAISHLHMQSCMGVTSAGYCRHTLRNTDAWEE